MAEVAIGVAKDKLISLLIAEAKLLKDVNKEVTEIASQLEVIQNLLKDADKRAEEEGDNVRNGVKAWVQQLREISFQIEDLVTEYTHHVTEPPPDCQGAFEECLKEIASFLVFCCSKLIKRHVLALKIRQIKPRFKEIHEQGLKDGFISSIQEGSTTATTHNVVRSFDPRDFSRGIREDELVGIESARDELIHVLSDNSSECTIIPLVGMGGSGKTTLAQKVYNDMQGTFQCHAWVEVPRTYTREAILRSLITELFKSTEAPVPHEIHEMNEKELKEKLGAYLKRTKYLVIFDDVWKEDFWGDIGHALVDENVGARIMITTRNMQVAKFCGSFSSIHVHEMRRLPVEKAWELFCKKTFKPTGCCPTELEKISGDIVERCEGLPLAIVVIAGVLSRQKKTMDNWRRFHASLSAELENNVDLRSITKILSLSYYELPYNLKSCLLYFGMFPRRHSIRNGRLIRQWIAEGFVRVVEGKTAEEVAQEYVDELISRSMVEASVLDITGKAKKCRVHDLLHEIILKKTKEVSFCQALSGSNDQLKLGGITRRLSIMNNSSNYPLQSIAFSQSAFSHIHSVVVFRDDEIFNSFVPIFAINFKFIKVLDFEDAPHVDHIPEDIGNLFDLRYLSVRGTKVSILPMSVGKLENLETLDLKKSFVCVIPADMINKLRKLKHLYGDEIKFIGMKRVCGIGGLKELQKLHAINVDVEGIDGLFKELGNLIQLRTLGISNLRSEDGMLLCGCIEKMKLLQSLYLSLVQGSVFDLKSMSSPPLFLQRLTLIGILGTLPKWFTQLQNLVQLRLVFSLLQDDSLEVLSKMPKLSELKMGFEAYFGEQLHLKEGTFPKLKTLRLGELSTLRSLIIEETALPVLELLHIGPCPRMEKVPSGLQHLKKLQYLVFDKMPQNFMISQDFTTVGHVPEVRFYMPDVEESMYVTLQTVLRYQKERMIEFENRVMNNIISRAILYNPIGFIPQSIWLHKNPPRVKSKQGKKIIVADLVYHVYYQV